MHLVVEAGVEEPRGGAQRRAQRRLRRIQRSVGDRPPRAPRALAELGSVFPPAALDLEASVPLLEEVARSALREIGHARQRPGVGAHGRHGFEPSAGVGVVQGLEDQFGEPIAQRQRQRHGRGASVASSRCIRPGPDIVARALVGTTPV